MPAQQDMILHFGGGSYPAVSTVDRIDYSNDTATAVAKGPLTAADIVGRNSNQSFDIMEVALLEDQRQVV